jgi:hypothetical protein
MRFITLLGLSLGLLFSGPLWAQKDAQNSDSLSTSDDLRNHQKLEASRLSRFKELIRQKKLENPKLTEEELKILVAEVKDREEKKFHRDKKLKLLRFAKDKLDPKKNLGE